MRQRQAGIIPLLSTEDGKRREHHTTTFLLFLIKVKRVPAAMEKLPELKRAQTLDNSRCRLFRYTGNKPGARQALPEPLQGVKLKGLMAAQAPRGAFFTPVNH